MKSVQRGVIGCTAVVLLMVMAAATANANPNEEATWKAPDTTEGYGGPEGVSEGFTSPYVLPAAEWRNDGTNTDGFRWWFSDGGWTATVDGETVCMMAPVYISGGVTIEEFYVTFVDTDTTANGTVNLMRVDNYGGTTETLSTLSSTGSAGIQSPYDTTISHVVSNNYSYYLTSCIYSDQITVLQARLWYNIPLK